MKFKEFYEKIDSSISFNQECFMDKECILDDCKEDRFNNWGRKTDSEKIDLFLETLEYWITNSVVKGIKKTINA